MFMSVAFNEAWVPNNARAVTPSDTTVLNCVALYVGAAGNVLTAVAGKFAKPTATGEHIVGKVLTYNGTTKKMRILWVGNK
jgi:hypothetical protein